MLYFLPILIFICSISANPTGNGQHPGTNIVGGFPANIMDHPYQVAIIQDGKVWCGGSVLTKTQVLTSGHCVTDATSHLVVYVGTSFWARPRSVHKVEDYILYGSKVNTDIAILNVRQPFTFDQLCQPVKIAPAGYKVQPGSLGVVTGWGVQESGDLSTQLLSTKVPVVDRETCSKAYSGSAIGKIVEGQFCAGVYGKDSCLGDAGSPFVIDGYQVGIVSLGYGCGLRDYPTVYVDVGHFNKWITKNMSRK